MSLEQKAQVLEAAASASCGVRDAVQKLTCKTSSVISLLKEMEQERLIELTKAVYSRRGRPKKIITCTPLGFEFLESFQFLNRHSMRPQNDFASMRFRRIADFVDTLIFQHLHNLFVVYEWTECI